jgi:hypothetical protein
VSRKRKKSSARLCVELYMRAHGFATLDDFNGDIYSGDETDADRVSDDVMASIWLRVKEEDREAANTVLDQALEDGSLK